MDLLLVMDPLPLVALPAIPAVLCPLFNELYLCICCCSLAEEEAVAWRYEASGVLLFGWGNYFGKK